MELPKIISALENHFRNEVRKLSPVLWDVIEFPSYAKGRDQPYMLVPQIPAINLNSRSIRELSDEELDSGSVVPEQLELLFGRPANKTYKVLSSFNFRKTKGGRVYADREDDDNKLRISLN